MAKVSGNVVETSPLDRSQDDSKEGESRRNSYGNPSVPTMKNGKRFNGAYGG